jgi:class 3 adenylate cyclase
MRIRGTELSLRRADMDPFGCALTGTAREYGRRVNLASRLEYHGEPGQILVSDSVADQLADDFLFSPTPSSTSRARARRACRSSSAEKRAR